MNAVLTVPATPSAPSLLLRPWHHDDVAMLTRTGFPAGNAEEIQQLVA